ncbi:hypothetical protein RSOLAG1IB_00993 [Rhizoctonia solani AG-1 IB]|uniref:BTB domain-containing protein n=1 Tax=Thanatephorus cucumeris (strain AG1-IB / isolate 7/3/14) TaxID=1108050 RepID=A0A0B7F887_THACB|nr:hypothetical protein RSOLAG1IB_00993 [Rhizoctonia solani AG-1 IB]
MPIAEDIMTEETTKAHAFAFQPPAGGDLVLKSSDGTTFNVHSVILAMASTVFADMFAGASNPDPVELSEDAESISLMLASIYPIAPPRITTMVHLEKIMEVSQKYDIQRMIKLVEDAVVLGSELLALDPMRIFYLSVTHKFSTIQALAAESFRPKNGNLLTTDGLLQLVRYFPHAASAVGLVGAQGARIKILDRVLVQSPQECGCYQLSVLGDISNSGARLPVCSSHPSSKKLGIILPSVPDYCILWLKQLRDELLEKPMHECDGLFRAASLANLGAQKCVNCITMAIGRKDVFEEWALNVKVIVQSELKALDVLYSL